MRLLLIALLGVAPVAHGQTIVASSLGTFGGTGSDGTNTIVSSFGNSTVGSGSDGTTARSAASSSSRTWAARARCRSNCSASLPLPTAHACNSPGRPRARRTTRASPSRRAFRPGVKTRRVWPCGAKSPSSPATARRPRRTPTPTAHPGHGRAGGALPAAPGEPPCTDSFARNRSHSRRAAGVRARRADAEPGAHIGDAPF